VMLVGPDVPTLARVMLELTEPAEELEDAPLRGGLASGSVRLREGDYYGDAVNLAARLTDLARPWSLLADEELEDELGGGFSARRIRPVRIRGLGLRRPLRVKEAEPPGTGG
jgi:adenylate cyclase